MRETGEEEGEDTAVGLTTTPINTTKDNKVITNTKRMNGIKISGGLKNLTTVMRKSGIKIARGLTTPVNTITTMMNVGTKITNGINNTTGSKILKITRGLTSTPLNLTIDT